ncbi:MAG: hypothetical protein HZA08_07745 [Nitrospirae bacterium]|nr:hypothetical protein [Nitrospirota bacterium]
MRSTQRWPEDEMHKCIGYFMTDPKEKAELEGRHVRALGKAKECAEVLKKEFHSSGEICKRYPKLYPISKLNLHCESFILL